MSDKQRESKFPSTLPATLSNEAFCRAFYCFLKENNREHHLVFWLEAEEFRFLQSDTQTRAQEIFESFFNSNSTSYLNIELSDDLVEEYNQRSPHCFESAQHSSFLFLSTQIESFINHDIYRNLVTEEQAAGKANLRKSKRKKHQPKKMKTGNTYVERLIKKNVSASKRGTRSKNSFEHNEVTLRSKTDEPTAAPNPSLARSPRLRASLTYSINAKDLVDLATGFNDEQVLELRSTFTKLLFTSPYNLAISIMETASAMELRDEVHQAIVDVFIGNGCLSSLLSVLFKKEIENFTGTNKAVLFRTDSPATMIMSKYLNRVAHPFLSELTKPIFEELESYPTGLEVDPSVDDTNVDVETNISILLSIVESLLDRIVSSAPNCPKMLKKDLLMIYKIVENKFEDTGQQILGSLLFLRFICPAIVSPVRYNLVPEQPTKQILRSYILVSKQLQNLVNGVENDGSKEHYMTKLNSFLSETNRKRLTEFMLTLIKNKSKGICISKEELTGNINTSEIYLKNFMSENFEELWTQVLKYPDVAIGFAPFFKIGLTPVRSCLSTTLGH